MHHTLTLRGASIGALVAAIALTSGSYVFAQDTVTASRPSSIPQAASPVVKINATQTSVDTSTKTTKSETQQTMATETEPAIVVYGDELPSAYGAPGSFSRSRFSTLTNAYVLPPGGVFAGLIYQGDLFTHGPTDHFLTQEVEVGLPYRFGVAIENEVEFAKGDSSNRAFSIEARWALADWNKIPLNPTLFAEYKFGTGKILHEEMAEEEMMDEGDDEGPPPDEDEEMREEEEHGQPNQPDAYEFRLLLSEEIAKNVQWSFNAFLENETSGDRGREWGFAQAIQMPLFLPHERFKAGIEMQYKNFTVKDTRGDPEHSFVIGPSFSFKPAARMRFDVSPLFGVTEDSPDVQVFAIFSYVFGGGGGEAGAEAPASTRNR